MIAEELRPRDLAVLKAIDIYAASTAGSVCTKVKGPRLLSSSGATATLQRLVRMGLVTSFRQVHAGRHVNVYALSEDGRGIMLLQPHEHSWDTEPVETVTYTPPADYDVPWVIRMCVGVGECDALLIDKGRFVGAQVYQRVNCDCKGLVDAREDADG